MIYAYCECDVAAIIVHTKDNKELLLGLECPNVALEKDISYFIHACRFAMRSFYSASSRLKQGRARPLETLAFRLKKKEFWDISREWKKKRFKVICVKEESLYM